MDHKEFMNGIGFRFLPPERKRPSGLRGLSLALRKVGVHIEVMNTQLPEDQEHYRRVLSPVCRVPRMSTFAVAAIINRIVRSLPEDRCFVNVGCWNGFTFLSGMAGNPHKRCIGIDNFSHPNAPRQAFLDRFERFKGPNHVFHEMGFEQYFGGVHEGAIGFYIYDGGHTYNDQYEGLRRAEPYFADDCLILVDDTNWDQVRQANLDFMGHRPGQYELIFDRRTHRNGHPTFWNGVMVLRRTARAAASLAASA